MSKLQKKRHPTVYVIAGPNGAGKTTFASKFLPGFVECREFVNADLIAAGLSPFAPELQNVRAGRLLLERISELARKKSDFAFETTLAGRAYAKRLRELQTHGYRIELFFLWLPSSQMAATRVQGRVRQGGHDIPLDDIRRRFAAGFRNLEQIYLPVVDVWWLFDGTCLPPRIVSSGQKGPLGVEQKDHFRQLENLMEELGDEKV